MTAPRAALPVSINRPLIALSLALLAAAVAAVALAAPVISPAVRQVEADQKARERDRDAAQAHAEAARAEVAQLQAQLAELNAAQQHGGGAISTKRLALAALTVRENDLRARLGGDQNQLARLLTVLEMFRRDPPPALLVDPHDVRDAVRAAILVRAMTPALEQRVAALKMQGVALQKLRRQADTASEALITSESDLAEQRAKIEDQILARTQAAREATTEASAAGQDIDTLAGRARSLHDLNHGLAAQTPTDAAAALANPEHAGLFGRARAFAPPAPGAPIRRFGDVQPGTGDRSRGWTWRTTGGPTVVAPAEGIVDYTGPLNGFGVVLILRLGGGYHLVLAGLDSALAAPGQLVTAGQPVGRMAKVDSPPADLYLEIRKNGAPVDPALWLKTPVHVADKR